MTNKKTHTSTNKTPAYQAVVSEMVREKIERAENSRKILINEINAATRGKDIKIEIKSSNLIFN